MKTTKSKVKSSIIGVKELRENLDTYIAEVGKGRTFTVVRRSTPVFRIAPIIDEWGDEGTWETVADFRAEHGRGIPMGDFAKLLRDSLKHGQKS